MPALPESASITTTTAPAMEDTTQVRAPSRGAMVASAVSGLQRFKQSWLNIMVLKGGIGLGQVRAPFSFHL